VSAHEGDGSAAKRAHPALEPRRLTAHARQEYGPHFTCRRFGLRRDIAGIRGNL
jgi:hypothetical protein